jgi:hypothetical protein
MNTKTINGVEFLVYKSGMLLNDETKSYYFEEDLDYDGDINCLNFYALKKVVVRGNQDVRGNQYVRGNQDVGGNQYVRGNQYVVGNQDVRGNQYVRGNQDVGGNQYVVGNQDVRGNQYVRGNQDVRGNQYVRGNQDVRFIKVYLFSKWAIIIDRDTDSVSIGCKQKTVKEWKLWFKNKETYNLSADDRNYLKLESAFKIACEMKKHLILMNDKPKD